MGVQGPSRDGRVDVNKNMTRHPANFDYADSDAINCRCMESSYSLKDCCNVIHEPFFLHPPGSKPRNGIYINPMSAYINEELQKSTSSKESFYLHSPHDLVYTKITRLFMRCKKDEPVTVDLNIVQNKDGTKVNSSEHAYEQICVRPEEPSSMSPAYQKSTSFDGSGGSNNSCKIQCSSSMTSTPLLSRHASNERVDELTPEISQDIKSDDASTENEIHHCLGVLNYPHPEPPPPPPPPLPPIPKQSKDVVVLVVAAEKKPSANVEGALSGASNDNNPAEPEPSSSCASSREDPAKSSHLINKHMVLPFIPPKFTNLSNDSETLLKPSEYLKSICKVVNNKKNSLSKARSVDNLDIQGREAQTNVSEKIECAVPPPPPVAVPLVPQSRDNGQKHITSAGGSKSSAQPLATISIQDLTSIQLKRTVGKINATKAFSVLPARSISMTNVSEPFFVQKTDLIAELKRTKDIPGIKKSKVEKAQVEKTQEQNLMSEINKAFNVFNFVDQIPEKDSSGNAIPIWKRQMLARKAAERARKELEKKIARESEEKRQQAIPPWKRQLLAKRDGEEKRIKPELEELSAPTSTLPVNIEIPPAIEKDNRVVPKYDVVQQYSDDEDQIIPWRAQLRKTNSKLKVLD